MTDTASPKQTERSRVAKEGASTEAALRESEARHRLLTGSWAQVVWETNAEGVVVADSPSWRAYTGQKLEEWLGYGWLDAIHPDDRVYAEHQWREAMAARSLVNAEFRLRGADGGYRWTNLRAAPVLDADGNVEKWAAMNVDIDSCKRAEAMLRESEERQAFLLHLSDALRAEPNPDAIAGRAITMLADRMQLDRCYVAANRLGEDRADILYQTGNNAIPALPGHIRPSGFPAALSQWSERTLAVDDITATPGLTENDRRNMAALGFGAVLSAAVRVGAGNPQWAIIGLAVAPRRWTHHEIALIEETTERTWAAVERARAEAAMRESKEKYRALFESMDEAYAVVEMLKDDAGAWSDFRFLEVNPAFMVHTGMPYPVGQTATELLGTPNPRWTELYGRVIDTGETLRLEESESTLGVTLDLNIFALDRARNRVTVLFTNITNRKRTEAALRKSEERLREFGDNSSNALWIVNVETMQLEYLSPAFEQIWGEGRESVLGDTARWAKLVHPDDRDTAAAAMPRLLAGESFVAEYRIVRPDGEVRWIRDAGFPIWEDGVVKRGGGIAQDVTELKQAGAAVRASEERLRQFGDASQDVLWARDAETLQWTYLSSAFEDIYGHSRQGMFEGNDFRNWLDLILPEDRAHAMESIERVRGGEQVAFEFRIRRPSDGGVRWMRNTDWPIADASGKVTQIGGIGSDITELREAEEQLKSLMAGIPQLVWRGVDSGYWTWASPQWTSYTGQAEADSHAWGWLEMIHPDDREPTCQVWASAAERGEFQAEYRVHNAADGSYRWFQTRATPVRDALGKIIEWLGTSTDIDELRGLQELQSTLLSRAAAPGAQHPGHGSRNGPPVRRQS